MKTKFISLLMASVMSVMCLYGQSYNDVKVGALSCYELLPGTPVAELHTRYSSVKFDKDGWIINDDRYLLSTEQEVEISPSGEKITRISYSYADAPGDWYLTWVFSCSYDSKGRLINRNAGASSRHLIYDERNLVVLAEYAGGGDYWKVKYKYDNNGHCIYEAEFYPKDHDEEYNPIYGMFPDEYVLYEILEVDRYGNWTARRSSQGEVETRTIRYW